MVVVAGAQGYCPNGGGYQDGGVLVVEKTFSSQTLTLKSISGGVGCSCWGGAGVAVVDSDLTSAPALVAGGGAGNTRAGGGLIGGWGANGYNSSCGPCGFSYDGTRGNYSVSSTLGMDNAQGGGGGYQASPIWVSRGGSGSTSVTVTAAGYRALNVVAGGWGPDVPAGTGNVGDGYVKIYRCDPKTLVCCGSDPFVPKCDNSGN